MKLGVMIPWGNMPRGVLSFSRFDLFSGLQAAILKIRLAVLKLTVVARQAKFLWLVYLIRPHHILPGFFI
jgi:hypothetical protein